MTEMDDGEYLYALSLTGHSLLITEGVMIEVKKEPGKSKLTKAINEKWISVKQTSKSEFDRYKELFPMLDYGEVEVLLCCLELKNQNQTVKCVIDEGAGRRVADQLGLEKTGTEGLLNQLNHLGIIDSETREKLLNKLNKSPFRLSMSNRGK
jgi:predicted nucleic acid-binding protein